MEQVWFLFLYGWVPAALVVLWEAVRCLRTDWRGEWKFLAWMLGLLAADLILWLVGESVLATFGLAWRSWLVSFFQGAALVLAVVWTLLVGLSVLCRDEAYSVVRKVILGVSICVVIGSAVTEGLFFWTFSTVEERVVTYQDQMLVEEDRGFLDHLYVYYEYHGPLVRGGEIGGRGSAVWRVPARGRMTKEGCGMYDGWMNLASLLLGLSAWFLPLWGLRRQSRKAGAEAALWCWAGALCCAAALYFQLRYGDSYVQDGDWSALMDTSGAAVWLSGFLLATSCVIQLAVLFAAHWRKRSED